MVGQTKIRTYPSCLPMSQDPRSASEISSRLVRAAAERKAPGLKAAGKERKIAETLSRIPTFFHARRASPKLEVLIEFGVARKLPSERGAWEHEAPNGFT